MLWSDRFRWLRILIVSLIFVGVSIYSRYEGQWALPTVYTALDHVDRYEGRAVWAPVLEVVEKHDTWFLARIKDSECEVHGTLPESFVSGDRIEALVRIESDATLTLLRTRKDESDGLWRLYIWVISLIVLGILLVCMARTFRLEMSPHWWIRIREEESHG